MFCGECGAKVATIPPPMKAPASAAGSPQPVIATSAAQPTVPVTRLIDDIPLDLLRSAPRPDAAPAVPPPPAAAPAPAPAPETLPPPPPALPAPAPATAAPPYEGDFDETVLAPRKVIAWQLVTEDGERHPIRTPTVIGRAPRARPGADPLALADPGKSLSKSHALLTPQPDALLVEDLGSTNGTIVFESGEVQTELREGQRVRATAGARLELGEFVLSIDRG
jgi:outer membrane biosynthesis protein TonB